LKKTKAQAEQTRQALLHAAEILFCERGAARASVLDIARTAGLTRGAFYHHFKDKTEVLAALIQQSRTPEYDPPALLELQSDPLSALQAFCTELLQHFVADPRQQRMFSILMQGREALGDLEPLVRARREELFRSVDAYEALLEQAKREGRLSPNWRPRTAAAVLYSMMLGLVDQWLRAPDSLDMRWASDSCIAQLFSAFRLNAAKK